MPGPWGDPPHRSLSEGRGLPYTWLYRALLPVAVLAVLAVLVVTFAAAFLFS